MWNTHRLLLKVKHYRLALLVLLALAFTHIDPIVGQDGDDDADELLNSYTVDLPISEKWCPPIRWAFEEAARDWSEVRGRRFTHKPNGGYGLPVVDKVGDEHLLHVGADLGWYQVGAPVFAIADGVVRLSTGPPARRDERELSPEEQAAHLSWGNVIVIEHRINEGNYVTAIYGHLGAERLVEMGDAVEAGQQIGTIGRQHRLVNGGYTPHLHFGVREGRVAEINASILRIIVRGEPVFLSIASLGEEQIELRLSSPDVPLSSIDLNGTRIEFERRDGSLFAPAGMLWGLQRPDFGLVGYELKTDGWKDPIAFLRDRNAHRDPAPFQLERGARR